MDAQLWCSRAEAPVKLIIQIPAFNEETTLPLVLASLPRVVPGVDTVEWLVIDDGSTDATSDVARRGGVDHVIRHAVNLGLARAFVRGIDACLQFEADIIVNLDADNQYCPDDIPALIRPILEHKAAMVVGTRPIETLTHFSVLRRFVSRMGSAVVRLVSGTDIDDVPSGFRAFSREAATQLNVFNDYTYTLETIIQAGRKGIALASVPVRVNPPTRPSRLIRTPADYIIRSTAIMFRILMVYRPMRFFMLLGSIPFAAGAALGVRYLIHYLAGHGQGMVQSLVLVAILLVSGTLLFVIAFVSDLIAVNRLLLEKIDIRLRRMESRNR